MVEYMREFKEKSRQAASSVGDLSTAPLQPFPAWDQVSGDVCPMTIGPGKTSCGEPEDGPLLLVALTNHCDVLSNILFDTHPTKFSTISLHSTTAAGFGYEQIEQHEQ